MPATFLTTAAAHHLGSTLSDFGETTVRAGGVYLWMADTRNGTDYTTAVPCAIKQPRRQSKNPAGFGLPEVPQAREVAVHCSTADLPFIPDPADENPCCLIAPAIDDPENPGTLIPDPDEQQKYAVTSYGTPATGTLHARLLLTLHD